VTRPLLRPKLPVPSRGPEHPLAGVLKFAKAQQAYLRATLRDLRCRVVKRERIDGKLQPFYHTHLELREEVRRSGQVVRPFAVYLEFFKPASAEGRRVLYIEGQNDNRMLARKGGKRFSYVVVRIDPFGEEARRESLVPINEISFSRMFDRIIDALERHRKVDPAGTNTRFQRFVKAKVNGRSCTVLRVTHPRQQEGLTFHIANVYLDDEYRLPIRIEAYLWPTEPDQPPPVSFEYTYVNVELNPGLTDAHFDEARVRED